jgi:hypothetical protein
MRKPFVRNIVELRELTKSGGTRFVGAIFPLRDRRARAFQSPGNFALRDASCFARLSQALMQSTHGSRLLIIPLSSRQTYVFHMQQP